MARVPLIQEQDHPELADAMAKYSAGRRGKLINVYRMLMHSPDLAESGLHGPTGAAGVRPPPAVPADLRP